MFDNFDFSKMGAMLEEAQKQAQKMQEDALLISAMNDVTKMVEDNKKLATTQMLSSIGGFGSKS